MHPPSNPISSCMSGRIRACNISFPTTINFMWIKTIQNFYFTYKINSDMINFYSQVYNLKWINYDVFKVINFYVKVINLDLKMIKYA